MYLHPIPGETHKEYLERCRQQTFKHHNFLMRDNKELQEKTGRTIEVREKTLAKIVRIAA